MVKKEIYILYVNLVVNNIDGKCFVIDYIKCFICNYFECYNLKGVIIWIK